MVIYIADITFQFIGQLEIALRGENWDFSHVELVTPSMTAGVATTIGTRTASGLLTVVLVLGAMPLVVVTGDSMSSLILVMTTLLTPSPALYDMLLSKTSPSGLCSSETWL